VKSGVEPNIVAHGLVHHLVDTVIPSLAILRYEALSFDVVATACSVINFSEARLDVHVGNFAIEEHPSQDPLAVLGSTAQSGRLRIALGKVLSELSDQGDGAGACDHARDMLVGGEMERTGNCAAVSQIVIEEGVSMPGGARIGDETFDSGRRRP
jgi:hypothetical protein